MIVVREDRVVLHNSGPAAPTATAAATEVVGTNPRIRSGILGMILVLEDAMIISEEVTQVKSRSEIKEALSHYRNRRLTRSAAVQGLSRFASDIIIRGFDTPCKVGFYDGKFLFENVNYAGVVTRLLQPILPIFFAVQFAFLYDGWKNRFSLEDVKLGLGIVGFGVITLAAFAATAGLEVAGIGLAGEALMAGEGAEVASAAFAENQGFFQELLNNIPFL